MEAYGNEPVASRSRFAYIAYEKLKIMSLSPQELDLLILHIRSLRNEHVASRARFAYIAYGKLKIMSL